MAPPILMKFIGWFITILPMSILLLSIRKNEKGTLTLLSDRVIMETLHKKYEVTFSQLRRVNFIRKALLSYKPYRIEFIYLDLKFLRLRLNSQTDFYSIFEQMKELLPENVELAIYSIETMENL
ncbi:MAG TPA: hypothetical protein VG603_12545 [Chitinophagales bacterium]|nr:hypothetical protein [Chitinophagales bacterium]